MKSTKIVAGILAAAITVSSIAPEAFAHIIGSDNDGYYFVDVADLMDDSFDISDVYGAKVRFTDESADIIQEGAGGTFVFSSDTENWDQLVWCIGCGEGETHDICWDSETNSVTRMEESPFFTEENLSYPGYARICLEQLWGDDINIKSISLLDKDGNELTSKDMPENPAPGDSSGGIEEPDEPYPGDSSGDVPEPGEEETDYIDITCSSVEQIQTPHPYKNNSYYSYTYTDESCKNLKVTFSDDSYTEQGCDTITLYDLSGVRYGTYSGYGLSGTSVLIPGNTVKIVLTTDSSVTDYGFSVESVENADEVPKQGDPEYDFVVESTLDHNDNYVYSLVSYRGAGGDIVVPSEINGKKIEKIGNGAFSGNTSLTSITIPDSVTYIDESAFANCANLSSVIMSDGIKTIQNDAFSNCTSLKTVTIPASATTIESYAFGYSRDDDWNYTKIDGFTLKYTKNTVGHLYAAKNGFTDEACLVTEELDDGTLKIIGYYGTDENYIIPSDINGKRVSKIGAYAFSGITPLINVEIPDSVRYIDWFAFLDCTSLATVTIPDGVAYISQRAFLNCTSLKAVSIPASVTNIDDYAFGYYEEYSEDTDTRENKKVDGFTLNYIKNTAGHLYAAKNGFTDEACLVTEELYDGALAITGYYGTDQNYIIPSDINGKKVTQIGSNAFANSTLLTSVTIPDSVTYIDELAFDNCTNLTSVVIPDSVTSIERYTFYNCTSLKNIVIPYSITSIYEQAFANCKSLESIALPDSITYIDTEAFFNCNSIKTVSIPASVTYIGDRAFGYVYDENWNYKKTDGFTLDYVKNTVGHIYALRNGFTDEACFVVNELDDGTLSIDGYAGTDETYTIPSEIDGKKVTEIGYKAFENCTSLKSVIIPEGIKSIEYEAFKDCTSLTSVKIPDSVTTVASKAFLNCTSLKNITIPEGVQNIYDYAFGYITDTDSDAIIKDEDFVINYVSGSTAHYYAYSNGFTDEKYFTDAKHFITSEKNDGTIRITGTTGHLRSAIIPEYINGKKVTEITELSEVDMISANIGIPFSYLDSVYIPKTVEYISGGSFRSCWGISIIEVDEDNPYYTSNNNVLYNKDMTELVFHSSGLYDNVFVIPDSVKTIGAKAFSDNSTVEEIILGANVTVIEDNAFENCRSLKTISIPEGVTKIGSNAFERCVGLKSVKLPESLVTVGYAAFNNCTSLTEIYIPAGVTTLGEAVFSDCTGLEKIEVSENNKNYCSKSGVLFDKDVTKLLFYPIAKTDKSYTVPDGIVEIGSKIFSSSKSLTEIKIPDSVKKIGYGTFMDCVSLIDINLPDSITDIDMSAFNGCSSLENITLPKNLKVIKNATFYNCEALKTVVLPDGLETIESLAFDTCTSLDNVVIPDSVAVIEQSAFCDCTSLGNIKMSNNVTAIGSRAFEGTLFVNKQNTDVKYLANWAIDSNRNAENITVKEGTIGLAGGIFSYNQKLNKVTLPDSLRYIGEGAFIGCSALASVTVPDGVTKLDYETFEYCSSLTEVNLPDSISDIHSSAFFKTPYLKNQTDSVKYAGKVAIGCDDNVEKILVKDGTLAIGGYAFDYNKSITEVILPNSLRVINKEAFYDCTGLKSIVIPASVKTIGEYAIGYYSDDNWNQIKDDGFKIYCYAGTAGEQYAKDNGFEYELLECKEHKFGNWKIIKAATCTATGTKTRTCSVCGKVETATIAKLTLAKVGGFKVKAKDSTSITLQWNKNTSATGYEIQKWDGKKWVAQAKIVKNSVTTYTVKNLKAGTTYKYKIRAYKTIGKATQYSGYVELSVNTNPTNMSGYKVKSKTATSVTLQWNKNTSATGYELQKWDGKKWVSLTKINKNSTTTYTVKSLKASTTYKYRIRAYKTIGKATQYSGYVELSVNTNPTNMSGYKVKSKTATSVTLQWNKNTSATGYELQKWDGKKWVSLTKINKNSTTTYTVKSLKASTTYKYRIRAYKTIGKATQYSAYTTTLSVNTNPTNMSGFKAKAKSYNSITLKWNKNASATGYELQKWDGKKWTTLTKISKNSATTYTVKSLKASTTYKYRIRAYKTIGKATQYSAYSATLSVNTNPSNMSGYKVKSKTSTSVTLQWNKNASATGYELQKWDGKKWVSLTKISKNSTTTYTIKSLKASTTYKYRIRAYKTIGKATQYSAYTATLSVNTNPSNMSGFKAKSKSYNSVTLQWNKNTSATGYELQKWNGKKWVTLTKIAKNSTTTYTVKSLKASTTYKYRIRAYKTIGKTTQYSAYSATLSVNTNPSNISGFKAKSTAKTSVTLQWNKNTSATGYEIQKWNGKKWVSAAKVTKNSTVTSTVKNLKKNTSYKFRIRAYKTIGKATQYSSWSGTLTVKTKK